MVWFRAMANKRGIAGLTERMISVYQSPWEQSQQQQEGAEKDIGISATKWEKVQEPEESRIPNHLVTIGDLQWREVGGTRKRETLNVFAGLGGVNNLAISNEYASEVSNTSSLDYPALTCREGVGTLRNVVSGNANKVQGMIGLKSSLEMVVNGTWYKTTDGSDFTSIKSGLSTTAMFDFVHFQKKVFATNATDKIWKSDGSSVSQISDATEGVKFITAHANRLYCAKGNKLYFSALSKPDDWTSVNDSGTLEVTSRTGGDITGISRHSGRLIIFTEESMHELYGTGPSDFVLKEVTSSVGCIAHRTIISISGILYFLGKDAIYRYGGGVPAKDFSIPVNARYIEKVNKATLDDSFAWERGKYYMLCLPATECRIYEYDTQLKTWNRQKYDDTRFLTCAPEILNDYLYSGTKDGKVLQLSYKSTGFYTKDDSALISWSWTSKVLNEPKAKANLKEVYLNLFVAAGASIKVSISTSTTGSSDFVEVYSYTNNTGSDKTFTVQEMIAYDLQLLSYCRFRIAGTGKAIVYELLYEDRLLEAKQL